MGSGNLSGHKIRCVYIFTIVKRFKEFTSQVKQPGLIPEGMSAHSTALRHTPSMLLPQDTCCCSKTSRVLQQRLGDCRSAAEARASLQTNTGQQWYRMRRSCAFCTVCLWQGTLPNTINESELA
jgi:hypothetical protein